MTLTPAPLPSVDTNPVVVNDSVSASSGLRAGQTLTLQAGGALRDNFAVVDATLNVEDGMVGGGVETSNSAVNISGGTMGGFHAASDSTVTISGGTVNAFTVNSGSVVNVSDGNVGRFNALSDSTVNISGGTEVGSFDAFSGSVVRISGGNFRAGDARSGSVVKISGGAIGTRFVAQPGSDVELVGGEFRLNGADFTGGTISLGDEDVFTGALSDGSPFILNDGLVDVTLTAASLPSVDLDPIVINAPAASGLSGLRAGQTLTVLSGGSLRDGFAVVDATLSVEAGIVGDELEVSNSVVDISGGIVGRNFSAFSGSEVNISGGSLDGDIGAWSGSVVNISGGTLRSVFVKAGSEVKMSGGTLDFVVGESGSGVNISGGSIRSSFTLRPGTVGDISGGVFVDLGRFFNDDGILNISGGAFDTLIVNASVANISGGIFDGPFHSGRAVSVANIFGSEFAIDGVKLDDLQFGQVVTITDRDVTLSGVLADGEPFSFDLNSASSFSNDYFDPDSTVTVTLTAPFLLGDVSQNGGVGVEDIGPFIVLLTTGEFQAEADMDQNGVVGFLDISIFIQRLFGE